MYIYVCLYIYVYDIYISAWDRTVFFYDFRLAFPINLFIFCRIPTDGNRQSTIGNLQLAISDRVYIWSAQKKLSKEVAIWAAAASIFANCWLVYLQDTLPLTPPALLFASILYLFFFFVVVLPAIIAGSHARQAICQRERRWQVTQPHCCQLIFNSIYVAQP